MSSKTVRIKLNYSQLCLLQNWWGKEQKLRLPAKKRECWKTNIDIGIFEYWINVIPDVPDVLPLIISIFGINKGHYKINP